MVSPPPLTFVLPYFNEADFIAATLESLGGQLDRRFALVAVDNASTDRGPDVAREVLARFPWLQVTFVREDRPGKIHALRRGIEEAKSPFIATIDADTIYPPEYVGRVLAGFQRVPGAAAVLAFPTDAQGRPLGRLVLQSRLFARKCHTGGFGQAFRRDALDAVGGFDAARWGWVLEDHEIVHRVARCGPLVYDAAHVCTPSDRRSDRSGCNWTLGERIAYKLLPRWAMDWFFYRFLSDRFAARGLANVRLREKSWQDAAAPQAELTAPA